MKLENYNKKMYQKKYREQEIYDRLWKREDVQKPTIWSLWEITKNFKDKRNLELGAGNCPRIPIKGGYFLDISPEATKNLKMAGGISLIGDVIDLPFEDNFFDLAATFETLEHIEEDEKVFSEIARVLKPSGFFLFSVPLRREFFNKIDSIAGHKRRYEITELKELLSKNNFRILRYRGPSFYIKIFNKIRDFPPIVNMLCNKRTKNLLEDFNLPRLIFNLHFRILSFLERKGAPKWRTDLKDLSEYKEKWIVMFCQKCE